MYYTYKDTPAGTLLFMGDGEVVTGMHWKVFKYAPRAIPDWIENESVFEEPIRQLEEYFAGQRTVFTFLYRLEGTDFQKAVWHELEKIPYGTLSSYRQIAHVIGRPKAVRAVGTAVGRNPLSIVVPCHRVLTSTLRISGYAGGVASKEYLLAREGIAYLP